MGRKTISVLVALVFVCSSVLFLSACAKKQVQVSEEVPAKAEEMKAQPVEQPKMTEAEAKAEEAKRQAKLRELEKAQKLAEEIRMFEAENVYFDFDKADLKPEAQAVLKNKATWLRENPSYSLRIEGHCDERGTNEYNLALGERRAHSAKKFLTALGIVEDRVSTLSYGEERPADPRQNEEAWAKNRRDEFKLIK